MIALAIASAAAVGGVVRLGLSSVGWRGTLIANVLGSLVLGFLFGWAPDPDVVLVVGTGFCGSLTTFSTFALEASAGRAGRRFGIVAFTTVACLAAATLGYAIGSAIG